MSLLAPHHKFALGGSFAFAIGRARLGVLLRMRVSKAEEKKCECSIHLLNWSGKWPKSPQINRK
jgi:hypothetical protein